MKKYLLAAAACVSSVAIGLASASADELPQWNGFYGGVNVGVGHSGSDTATGTADLGFFELSLTRSFDLDTGLIGGAQLGYNFQHDRFVFGFETDFNGADLSSEPGALLGGGRFQLGSFTSDVNWFGTARARAGVLLDDDFLFYATGGLAYGEVSNSIGVVFGRNSASISNTDVRLGWTAGAGVETVLRSNMKLKLEYLYFDLGSETFFDESIFGIPVTAKSDANFHAARVGLNIDFDTPLFGQ